ncbi:MAG: hypothetical protein K8I30_19680 [Anaerolineae bacterium]|nr:hypothetical protein [Anaerolineae bacterium]
MYRLWGFVRFLIIVLAAAAILGAVALRISEDEYANAVRLYNGQLTVVVGTAIADALNSATRTAEAPLKQYRLISVPINKALAEIAVEYDTTLEIIRLVNGLAPDVIAGDGGQLVIPEGVTTLNPPRRLIVYRAIMGDTLLALSQKHNVPLTILEEDNPVLARRELIPGDIVYIAEF